MSRVVTATSRHARLTLALAGLLAVVAAAVGFSVVGLAHDGGFDDPGSQSSRVSNVLDSGLGGEPDFVLLATVRRGHSLGVDDPQVVQAGRQLTARLAAQPGVTHVLSYWSTGIESLRSRDGRSAVVTAHLQATDDAAVSRASQLRRVFDPESGPLSVQTGSRWPITSDIEHQVKSDLVLAELLAAPLIFLLLFVAFRGAVPALLPLAIGGLATTVTLLILSVLARITNVSIFALNLTTAMALGLGVDYALLIVSRYREEREAGADGPAALERTMATAGRTVLVSAGVVSVALAALLVFPLYFLRSFAYAGIAVTSSAAIAAIVVMPALITVLGPRVDPKPRRQTARSGGSGLAPGESPAWHRIGTAVTARPWLIGLPILALLLAAGLPFLRVQFGSPDDRVLPPSAQSRQVGDTLRAQYSTDDVTALQVLLTGHRRPQDIPAYATRLSALPNVARVDTTTGSYTGGRFVAPPTLASTRFAAGHDIQLAVIPSVEPHSVAAEQLVRHVRALPPPTGTTVGVTGRSARLVDELSAIGNRLPLALGWIALTTLILLFLFTGSLVLPLKALVLNVVSLSAVFGALVWIFQDGHLSGVLGFTPGPVDASMPVLLFCVAFGLSMDYEVFLLARIKEAHDRGAPNREAIVLGLSRTGRILTMAALVVGVTMACFATSKVTFVQLLGVGTAIAIIVDATVIRGILVPAFMQIAGRANWWPDVHVSLHRRTDGDAAQRTVPAPRTAASGDHANDSGPVTRSPAP